MAAYITSTSEFLPNAPVSNDDLDKYSCMFGAGTSAAIKRMVLRNNGIHTRYYAIDPESGCSTHTNAKITAQAIRHLLEQSGVVPDQIQSLCCGTSGPDQILPGHASMVHGELACPPCEALSFSGICGAGAAALKHAWLTVASGNTNIAIATGSEVASSFFRMAPQNNDTSPAELQQMPSRSFGAEFLKWMLSDGAGAALVCNTPNANDLSLRIEWIDQRSYANELPTCMYAGARKNEDNSLTGWREIAAETPSELMESMLIHQDVKLLNESIVAAGIDKALCSIAGQRNLSADQVDWFLPHYSSEYFRKLLFDGLHQINFPIPYEKWFTNLCTKGNTGSASFFIMLNELLQSGKVQRGQTILGFVPESGRFSFYYMLLTVV